MIQAEQENFPRLLFVNFETERLSQEEYCWFVKTKDGTEVQRMKKKVLVFVCLFLFCLEKKKEEVTTISPKALQKKSQSKQPE